MIDACSLAGMRACSCSFDKPRIITIIPERTTQVRFDWGEMSVGQQGTKITGVDFDIEDPDDVEDDFPPVHI
jgi:hypothetical protein